MIPVTVAEAARRFGDRIAYVSEHDWSVTYADIDRISDEVAAGLAREGVREGDVVALVLPPGIEYLLAYCAAAKLGAITAGVNSRLSERERVAVLEVAQATIVIDDVNAVTGLRVAGVTPPPLAPNPERPVAIIFTSGTTGLPKGALYCNSQLEFITQTDTGGAWDTGGRAFSGTSFAHLGFMTKLPGSLQRGGTTFIMERWRAGDALELLAREKMSSVAGVPTQLALMLRHPDFDSFDLSSVKAIIAGGGPVTPGLAEEARRRFGALLATRYSCTEAGIGLGTAFDDPEEDAIVSVGRPHASVELSLFDAEEQPVAAGEVGEVCLRSAAVMTGYWRDPEQTAAAFTSDRFRAHRRSRLDRRSRPPPARRSEQGDVRTRWIQRVSRRSRRRAVDAPRRRRDRDRASPRQRDGRDRRRRRGPPRPGAGSDRRGAARVRGAECRGLQAARSDGRAGRATAHRGRKG